MIAPKLKIGELWEINGEPHYLEQVMGGGFLLFRAERTGSPYQIEQQDGSLVSPTIDWLKRELSVAGIRRLAGFQGPAVRQRALAREDDVEAIRHRDPKAAFRQLVVRSLDRLHFSLSDQGIRYALARLWAAKPLQFAGKKAPSPSSVRRWLRCRGAVGERPLRAMASMAGLTPRTGKFPASVQRRMHRVALMYWSSKSGDIADAYADLCVQLNKANAWSASRKLGELPVPSRETFRLCVRRLECWETVATRFGKKEADTRYKACKAGLTSTRPLLLGAMDHTPIDVHVVIDINGLRLLGKPTLTVLIDVYSRCILGWVLSFEPPSLYSVMECIKRANRPKIHLLEQFPDTPELADIYGKFDEIVVDNGWEFTGTSFEYAMVDVGTTIRWAPTYSPQHKAVVERFFWTLKTRLVTKLPGATYPIALLRQWGIDPSKDAVLTLDQVERLIWAAISRYHRGLHRTLDDSPLNVWNRGVREHGIQFIGDDRQLDKMAGAHEKRTLSRSGLSLFNIQYHDPAITGPLLEKLASHEPMRCRAEGSARAKVTVKYNPANLGEVHIWDPTSGLFVTMPSVDPDYTDGLTLWQHRQIAEWTKENAKGDANRRALDRVEMRREIEAASPEALRAKKRAYARLLSSPKIEAIAGDRLRIAYAPPRHDGMAPPVPMTPLAFERTDDGATPSRPPRGGKKKRPHRKTGSPQTAPETGEFPRFDQAGDGWEEFQ